MSLCAVTTVCSNCTLLHNIEINVIHLLNIEINVILSGEKTRFQTLQHSFFFFVGQNAFFQNAAFII